MFTASYRIAQQPRTIQAPKVVPERTQSLKCFRNEVRQRLSARAITIEEAIEQTTQYRRTHQGDNTECVGRLITTLAGLSKWLALVQNNDKLYARFTNLALRRSHARLPNQNDFHE